MDLSADVILSLTLSSKRHPCYNVLTVHSNGKATYQLGFGSTKTIEKQLIDFGDNEVGDSKTRTKIESYLQAHLPMIDEFLSFNDNEAHYYEIPSQRSCGTAANLYVRFGEQENWVGISNYDEGRVQDIPSSVDANMYKGVLKFLNYLTEG